MDPLYTAQRPYFTPDVFYHERLRRSPWLNSLIAHWKLNESSGVRADSHSGLDLAEVNTVASATGKIGSAASFIAGNEEALVVAEGPELSMGDIDFTIAFWVWFDSLALAAGLLGKWGTGSLEYLLFFDGTNIRFYISDDGSNTANVANSQAIAINTWYLCVAWHDATANTINLSINNNTPASAAHATGVYDGASALFLGLNEEGLTYFSGRLDSVSIWKRLLTATERTQLYNAGAGLDYPFS